KAFVWGPAASTLIGELATALGPQAWVHGDIQFITPPRDVVPHHPNTYLTPHYLPAFTQSSHTPDNSLALLRSRPQSWVFGDAQPITPLRGPVPHRSNTYLTAHHFPTFRNVAGEQVQGSYAPTSSPPAPHNRPQARVYGDAQFITPLRGMVPHRSNTHLAAHHLPTFTNVADKRTEGSHPPASLLTSPLSQSRQPTTSEVHPTPANVAGKQTQGGQAPASSSTPINNHSSPSRSRRRKTSKARRTSKKKRSKKARGGK
ncbi:hypothetical protein BKA82DRAFT_18052, partial [Pisolithus tinctorius]